MALHGNLHSMPAPELLGWIASNRKTGTLEIERRAEQQLRQVFFHQGAVVGAFSNQDAHRLGWILVQRGTITPDQLAGARMSQGRTSTAIGHILQEMGLLDEAGLQAALANQSEEVIFSLFRWTDGEFTFREGDLPNREFAPPSLSLEHVMMEASRRQDEWERIRAVIPDGCCVPSWRNGAAAGVPAADPPDWAAARISSLVTGRRSVNSIVRLSNVGEFRAYSELARLLEQNRIQLSPPPTLPLVAVGQLILEGALDDGLYHFRNGNLGEAIPCFKLVLDFDSEHLSAREMLQRANKLFLIQAEKNLPPAHACPRRRQSLEGLAGTHLNLSQRELYLLSRVDGRTTLRDLCRLAPPVETALQAIFRLMLSGLIHF